MDKLEQRIKELEQKWERLNSRQLKRPLDQESSQIVKDTIFVGEDPTNRQTSFHVNVTAGVNYDFEALSAPAGYFKVRSNNKEGLVPYFTP